MAELQASTMALGHGKICDWLNSSVASDELGTRARTLTSTLEQLQSACWDSMLRSNEAWHTRKQRLRLCKATHVTPVCATLVLPGLQCTYARADSVAIVTSVGRCHSGPPSQAIVGILVIVSSAPSASLAKVVRHCCISFSHLRLLIFVS